MHQELFQKHDSSSPTNDLMAFSPKSIQDSTHTDKLLVGMLSGITGMVSMLSGGETAKFESLSTPEYRLDFYETRTGYCFVILSHPSSFDVRTVQRELEKLYTLLFVPLVIRNPLFDPKNLTGDLRDCQCDVFVGELRSQFESLIV